MLRAFSLEGYAILALAELCRRSPELFVALTGLVLFA